MRAIWSDLRQIVLSRWRALSVGLLCTMINRLSGLVLPYSVRFLIDDVISKHNSEKLVWLVLVIAGATIVQGVSSFVMAQSVARLGHKLVFELRQKVQQHVGKLSLSYHETNKVGGLVSRIMSDVDEMRSL